MSAESGFVFVIASGHSTPVGGSLRKVLKISIGLFNSINFRLDERCCNVSCYSVETILFEIIYLDVIRVRYQIM